MKLKDLIFNREKLGKYDELKEWKEYFGNKKVKISLEQNSENPIMDVLLKAGIEIPDNIRKIIVDALEAEIENLDEK